MKERSQQTTGIVVYNCFLGSYIPIQATWIFTPIILFPSFHCSSRNSHNQYFDYSATFRGDLQASKRRKKKYSFIGTGKPCTQRRQECWHSRTVSRRLAFNLKNWPLPLPIHPRTSYHSERGKEGGGREEDTNVRNSATDFLSTEEGSVNFFYKRTL